MVGVLSLAPCYSGKKPAQVRPGDQPGYPKDTIESFVGHSSMGLLCPPATFNWIRKDAFPRNTESECEPPNIERSFTSVQMFHTHTLPKQGTFSGRHAGTNCNIAI